MDCCLCESVYGTQSCSGKGFFSRSEDLNFTRRPQHSCVKSHFTHIWRCCHSLRSHISTKSHPIFDCNLTSSNDCFFAILGLSLNLRPSLSHLRVHRTHPRRKMSFTTIFVSDASFFPISPTTSEPEMTTVTCRLSTTLRASQGQTVTITSPPPAPPLLPTTAATTVYSPVVATKTSTVTLTELDVFLQNPEDGIYSTRYISFSPTPVPSSSPADPPTYLVFVVETETKGWDGWSKGEKAGLVTGIALAVILIVGLFCWFFKRRNVWVAHGWWPFMASQHAQYSAPMAQPGYAAGAMVPYAYGQPQSYYNPGR